MKQLIYCITINKPRAFVFDKIRDKTVYPQWAKAWGEGMSYVGEWVEGGHVSFFDQDATKNPPICERFARLQQIRNVFHISRAISK